MIYLRSFSIHTDKVHPFPFNIPAVRHAQNLVFDSDVTIFVGDNGSGKSTILECIGQQLNLPLIGGYIQENQGFEAAKILKEYVSLDWKHQSLKGFFFRAEDFSDFINAVQREKNRINNDLGDLFDKVQNNIIDEMSASMNYRLRLMLRDYGEDMQAYSHGEAFLKILETRITEKGIYLLDEPEAALSPLKQLSLLSFLLSILAKQKAQFIIATHSPIIMGIPGAKIYQVNQDGMEQVKYTETEHYSITKNFLSNPETFLRYL